MDELQPVNKIRYIHGHHSSVLNSHKARTAKDSCGYFLRRLKPDMHLLDVGCGPGSISCDLAKKLSNGKVIGIDNVATAIKTAQLEARKRKVDNIEFYKLDVFNISRSKIKLGSFDVIHIHQVLQHLSEPVKALIELKPLLKQSGFFALRESDYGSFIWYPEDKRLTRWMSIYQKIARANSVEPNAGRMLKSWTVKAGLVPLKISLSAWIYSTEDQRAFWANAWSQRALYSNYATEALRLKLASRTELADISEAFKDWAAKTDAFFSVNSVEIIAKLH